MADVPHPQRGSSFLLGLIALAALGIPFHNAGQPAAAAGAQARPAPAEGAPATAASKPEEAPFAQPLRLYHEFFGISAGQPAPQLPPPIPYQPVTLQSGEPKQDEADQLREIARSAREAHYELRFMIALVPDPIDSHLAARFDQMLAAIQLGVDPDYLLDRMWLPWTGKPAETKLYRDVPGALLFRGQPMASRHQPNGSAPADRQRLLMVFLVGETPKQGLHKQAFRTALELADRLLAAASDRSVGILGPAFSGSAESLRIALSNWRLEERDRLDRGPSPRYPPVRFPIITGSATAPGLEAVFRQLGDVTFARTVLSDDIVADKALRFLQGQLGWDLRQIAILTESDTEYGRSLSIRQVHALNSSIDVPLLGGLTALRNAWEEGGAPKTSGESPSSLSSPRLVLDLSLADKSEPVDISPEFSGVTARANELAIPNLLTTLSRGNIRYIGMLFTDSRDELFLARRIREFCPDKVLFTFGNDLLYAHPQYSADMDGMLVLGSYPLAEGPRWRTTPNPRFRPSKRQFTSEGQEGVFHAVRALLRGTTSPLSPDVWLGAVGNGSIWPMATIKPRPGGIVLNPWPGFDDMAGRAQLELCLFALMLGSFGFAMQRTALPPRGLADAPEPRGRRLLILGFAVLAIGAGLLALLELPRWWQEETLFGWYLAATLIVWMLSAWRAARSGSVWAKGVTWCLTVLVAFFALALLTHGLWMPGGPEYFHSRARKLSSGLSPMVSLAWLGAAVLLLTLRELQRYRLIVMQGFDWPLEDFPGPTFPSCRRLAARVEKILAVSVPRGDLWFVFVPLLVLTFTYLWHVVQPICETIEYGRIFLLLVAGTLVWSTVAFYRFVQAWRALVRLLLRIEHTPVHQAFTDVAKVVCWSPMKSFDWKMPTVQMPILSVEQLHSIETVIGHLQGADTACRALQNVLDKDATESRSEPRRQPTNLEILARAALKSAFRDLYRELAGHSDDKQVIELFAVGAVAYIRYVFAQMSNCLTAAMGSGLLILAAVRTYAFEPKRFVSAGIFGALLAAAVMTVWAFIQMDRNASLSAISGTTGGEVQVDRHLVSNILTYGVIPVAGIVITQFPSVGQYLVGWINPLLHVVGSG
jgi:hypothetical protein